MLSWLAVAGTMSENLAVGENQTKSEKGGGQSMRWQRDTRSSSPAGEPRVFRLRNAGSPFAPGFGDAPDVVIGHRPPSRPGWVRDCHLIEDRLGQPSRPEHHGLVFRSAPARPPSGRARVRSALPEWLRIPGWQHRSLSINFKLPGRDKAMAEPPRFSCPSCVSPHPPPAQAMGAREKRLIYLGGVF